MSLKASPLTLLQINFLVGSDGKPWVWVMGEHARDLPYEELVRRREREEAEREMLSEIHDRREAEELAKNETRDILSVARASISCNYTWDVLTGMHHRITATPEHLYVLIELPHTTRDANASYNINAALGGAIKAW